MYINIIIGTSLISIQMLSTAYSASPKKTEKFLYNESKNVENKMNGPALKYDKYYADKEECEKFENKIKKAGKKLTEYPMNTFVSDDEYKSSKYPYPVPVYYKWIENTNMILDINQIGPVDYLSCGLIYEDCHENDLSFFMNKNQCIGHVIPIIYNSEKILVQYIIYGLGKAVIFNKIRIPKNLSYSIDGRFGILVINNNKIKQGNYVLTEKLAADNYKHFRSNRLPIKAIAIINGKGKNGLGILKINYFKKNKQPDILQDENY